MNIKGEITKNERMGMAFLRYLGYTSKNDTDWVHTQWEEGKWELAPLDIRIDIDDFAFPFKLDWMLPVINKIVKEDDIDIITTHSCSNGYFICEVTFMNGPHTRFAAGIHNNMETAYFFSCYEYLKQFHKEVVR